MLVFVFLKKVVIDLFYKRLFFKSHGSSTVKGTFTASHDGTGGNLTLSLTDVQTAAIEAGRYVYDVLQTDASGDKTRLMEGQLIMTPSVSRS